LQILFGFAQELEIHFFSGSKQPRSRGNTNRVPGLVCQPPAALCQSHIGDAEILGQLPHRLGLSELVEIFAGHGQRRFFVFVHSDLSRLVKLEPAFSLAP
jgi:hypothetical protein